MVDLEQAYDIQYGLRVELARRGALPNSARVLPQRGHPVMAISVPIPVAEQLVWALVAPSPILKPGTVLYSDRTHTAGLLVKRVDGHRVRLRSLTENQLQWTTLLADMRAATLEEIKRAMRP